MCSVGKLVLHIDGPSDYPDAGQNKNTRFIKNLNAWGRNMYRGIGSGIACSLLVLGALQSEVTPAKAGDDADLKVILQRLNKLEKENDALKTQLKQIEGKTVATEKRSVQAEKTAKSAEAAMASAPAGVGPVKGVPVKYVRVCDEYGPGFFYIPGTPGCMKIGGYLRLQGAANASGDGIVTGADTMASQGRFDRFSSNDLNYQARAAMSLDVRLPTNWGLLRGYVRGGLEMVTPFNNPNNSPPSQNNTPPAAPLGWWDRGFIEFAGFTVGKQRSFFDMFDPVSSYTYGNPRTTGDTDLTGVIMAGYTARFGAGWSASVSVEDPNGHNKFGVCDASSACWAINGIVTTDNGLSGQSFSARGLNMPDVVGNLRVDQPWGYLGLSGAVHQVAGAYYTNPGSVNNGHPDNKLGYAVSGAGKLFIPGMRGDSIGLDVAYSQGAPGYVAKGAAWQLYNDSSSVGVAWGQDGIFDSIGGISTGSIQLTKSWSINGAYQHLWDQQWITSVYGGYTATSYNQNATNIVNSHLPGAAGTTPCGVPVAGAVWPPLNIPVGSGNSCSPNYSFWQIGSRTQYRPVDWLDVGVDVTYTKLNTAYAGSATGIYPANNQRPAVSQIADQDVLSVLARVQLNFNP